MDSRFDTVESVLEDVRAGRLVIVTDDEKRENEGDLVCAAEKITPEHVNFMITHARGLVCAPITEARAKELGIYRAPSTDHFKTAFTESVDILTGTTGISASDRAATIRALLDPAAKREDFGIPGHVFPIAARPGGVLQRTGHTEASVDLARLAGLQPAAVICEITKDDGTMARLDDLAAFKEKFGLKLCSIASLIEYRRKKEKLVEEELCVKLPTAYGDFMLHMFRSKLDDACHLALVHGDVASAKSVLVRMHSECLTGDVFGSMRCDCGDQLHTPAPSCAIMRMAVWSWSPQSQRMDPKTSPVRHSLCMRTSTDFAEATSPWTSARWQASSSLERNMWSMKSP